MTVSEFNNSTLAETLTWMDARAKARNQSERYFGELLRWLGSIVANVFGGKKRLKPTDLFKFPDEEIKRHDIKFVGNVVELTKEQSELKDKMLIAALKYQNGNDRKRNDTDWSEHESASVWP